MYIYLPPYKNVLRGRTTTSIAGTPDATYPLSYLTDLRPAYPVRYPPGPWGLSISVDTEDVQLVVIANHSIDDTIALGGGLSGTIAIPTPRKNGANLNPFKLYSSPVVGVTSITISGTNTLAMFIGECLAGVPVTFPALKMENMQDAYFDGTDVSIQGDYMNVPNNDEGRLWRVLSGSQNYTPTERAMLEEVYESQKTSSEPGALIMNGNVNDARLVIMREPTFKANEGRWDTTLTFLEYPRYSWNRT